MLIINDTNYEEVEKFIDFDLFNQMDNYFDSIDQNNYWPKTSEYSDMMILWSAQKTGVEPTEKDGALGYPDGWDSMLDKIKDLYKNN